jgi:TonB-linked SusC/RagA family outer membrane protein
MLKRLLLLIGFLPIAICVVAQVRTLTGTIVGENGNPVPFATVAEVGTKNSVQADENGKFTIKVTGNELRITAVGFAERTVPATAGQITLTAKPSEMAEVVVTTSLGLQRPAKELGYATAKINNKELTQARAVNLQQGLAGKVSGLNITTNNNSVFENTRINLRGIRSLTGNNQPLLVVDGVPTPLAFMSSLNPNDVVDANILKGASAAAIYGPDGVNGVIIITTRKGTRAQPIITLSSSYQISRVSFMPKRQRTFGTGASTDAFGNAVYDPFENFSYGDRYDGSLRNVGHVLEDGTFQQLRYAPTPDDEQKKFFNESGSVLQNDVSFATQDFYISFQDAKIKGSIPGDERRRTSFRFNAGKEYGRFKTTFNINYIQSNYDVMSAAAYSGRYPAYNGSIYNAILQVAPHIPLSQYKNWRDDKFAQYSNYYNEYAPNPYWVIDNHRQNGRTDDLLASLDLKFTVAPWMAATARIGTSVGLDAFKTSAAPITPTAFAQTNRNQTTYSARPGLVGDAENFTSRINADFFLNGRKDFNDFSVNYVAGTMVRQNETKFINVQGNNLVVPFLYNISNRSSELVGNEGYSVHRLSSLYGSIGFGYKGWASVEFTARNDWDSRLAPENNSYFYPGVNASLVLSDAIPLLKNSNTLSYAKLRASYAKSGNVNLGVYALDPTYTPPAGFPFNVPGFTADNQIPDPSLKPEFVVSKEVGIELAFLNNRLGFDATYFHQSNTDQILAVQTSSATGYTSRVANTADFENYGVELDLRLTPLVNIGKNARIDFKVNATYNDNRIIRLSDDATELNIAGSNQFLQTKVGASSAFNYAIVGMPAFVFKLTDYERDPEGRVIVNENGDPSLSDSLITAGRTMPKWILGFTPSFSWKSFSISMTWDFKTGHHMYHGIGNDMDGYGISARSAQYDRDRFVFPNSVYFDGSKYVPNTDRQVSGAHIDFWGNNSTNTQIATNYFTSAAAWKLRELAINYDLPTKWTARTKVVKKASIGFVARNLFTFLPKSNQWSDPEFNYTSNAVNANANGLGSPFETPPMRTFGGSITLTF